MPITGICKRRPWLFGLQGPKAAGGASVGSGRRDRERLCQPRDLPWGSRCPLPAWALQLAGLCSCPGPTSSPGTTARRTRLGGTETGWRLNRKWEWGFLRGRQ